MKIWVYHSGLVEALSPLQAMGVADLQDRDPGVPERLQSLESSVAALSESVAFLQGLAWQKVHVVASMAKSSPSSIALEKGI